MLGKDEGEHSNILPSPDLTVEYRPYGPVSDPLGDLYTVPPLRAVLLVIGEAL